MKTGIITNFFTTIVIRKIFIRITKSITAGLLLSTLIERNNETDSNQLCLTDEELLNDTCLSPEEFEMAKNILCKKKFIKIVNNNYFIEIEKIVEKIEEVEK
jgi:hypothetical protein